MSHDEDGADPDHADYEWCVTEWYDGPLRAWAPVPEYEGILVELRTNLAWTNKHGDVHVRLDRADLQHALAMLDGAPVRDFRDEEYVYADRRPLDPRETPEPGARAVEERFHVRRGGYRSASLPWPVVEAWRAEIERNHRKPLERLHDLGGLTPRELWLAAHGHGPTYDVRDEDADAWLASIAASSEGT